MNFDILFRVVALAALFMAGYNIGWERGFNRCRKIQDATFKIMIGEIQKEIDKSKELHERVKNLRSDFDTKNKTESNGTELLKH
jgi:hypothetical protein